MTAQPATDQSDPTLRLPRDVYYLVVHTLRGALPPPPTEHPEDLVRRDNAAIAEVASMLPANANEATIAATCVAANARAMDALAEAREAAANGDRFWQQKCTAQSISLMREARGARTLLLRLQTAREQREKDNAACDRAAWSEHCTISLMRQGLADAGPADEPAPPVPAGQPQASAPAAVDRSPAGPAPASRLHRSGGAPPDVRSTPPTRGPDRGVGPGAGAAVLDRTAPPLRALHRA
jgi:hypothetical protein